PGRCSLPEVRRESAGLERHVKLFRRLRAARRRQELTTHAQERCRHRDRLLARDREGTEWTTARRAAGRPTQIQNRRAELDAATDRLDVVRPLRGTDVDAQRLPLLAATIVRRDELEGVHTGGKL